MKPVIGGIHHITAIASDPQRNIDFYTGFLPLRLVKQTVNFDDPGTYHFYYGDYHGSPGTLLTFFPWPGARRGRSGPGQVTAVAFSVPLGTLSAWETKARANGVLADAVFERFGQRVLRLYDPDWMAVELIEVPGAQHEFGLLAAPTLEVAQADATEALLSGMAFRLSATEGSRRRYIIGDSTVDLMVGEEARRGLGGAGTVHHIAWRTPDAAEQNRWLAELAALGHEATPVMDRNYFQSIYFREPGGILFEIATDAPGFTVDEALESLGRDLKLPPWMESSRSRIEAALPPIRVPGVTVA